MYFLSLLICRFVWRIGNSVILERNFILAVRLHICVRRFDLCWPSFSSAENDFFQSNKRRFEEKCANDGKYQCQRYVTEEEIDLFGEKEKIKRHERSFSQSANGVKCCESPISSTSDMLKLGISFDLSFGLVWELSHLYEVSRFWFQSIANFNLKHSIDTRC